MFDKWLKLPAHYYLHITALSLLSVGVALSNVLMSIGTIWIIANWLIELDFSNKWQRFKSNKTVIAITLFFGLMVLSLTWSQNIEYGLRDLLIKLPFITIPLVMGTIKPLEQKTYRFLLYLILVSLSFTTLFNFIRYSTQSLGDIRAMSFFISHIRLGGIICLALFLIGFETYKGRMKYWLTLPSLAWLMYYLYRSQTLSAYVLLFILVLTSLFFILKRSKLKYVLLLGIIGLVTLAFFYIKSNITEPYSISKIDSTQFTKYTENGNPYYYDSTATTTENGNYVWIFVSIEECEIEWNKRSKIRYDSTDLKNQPIYGTLFRYMTSKNLKKDSIGFLGLTNEDIKNIENGQTNYIQHKGVKGKIAELSQEYYSFLENGNPNGHSFIQRVEHLKTAVNLVKKNWLFGVGLGDIQGAFESQYIKDNSKLNIENRLRSHNQFLSVWISLGLFGFLLIVFILFQPLAIKNIDFTVLIVSIALVFGFITQDLIETQAGVTIFALFYAMINFKEKNGSIR